MPEELDPGFQSQEVAKLLTFYYANTTKPTQVGFQAIASEKKRAVFFPEGRCVVCLKFQFEFGCSAGHALSLSFSPLSVCLSLSNHFSLIDVIRYTLGQHSSCERGAQTGFSVCVINGFVLPL